MDPFYSSPVSTSPPRRNTFSAVGISPPKGFHSWLVGNGLSVVNNLDLVATSGLTGTLGCSPRTLPVPGTTATAAVNPAPKSTPYFDLTKDTDNNPIPTSKETESSKSTTKAKPEFSDKGIEKTGLISLSKHWHDKLKRLEGYIPLLIFNIDWLKQDLLRTMSHPRTSKDKDNKYVGLAVPEEWKMSIDEWVTLFNLFVAYLYHYKHEDLAEGFKVHKENCQP